MTTHFKGGIRQSNNTVNVTDSAVTVDKLIHGGKVVRLNRAAGIAVTLPASTGSGEKFRFYVGTTISSNSTTIKVANATDTMVGAVHTATTTAGAGLHEAAGGTDDTITMNGTTTGGIVGSYIEVVDVESGKWLVNGELVGSGTLATTLSATVS